MKELLTSPKAKESIKQPMSEFTDGTNVATRYHVDV